MARDLKVLGDVKIFGSFANGFKTGTSDLEVVLSTKVSGKETVSLLQKLAQRVIEYGFTNKKGRRAKPSRRGMHLPPPGNGHNLTMKKWGEVLKCLACGFIGLVSITRPAQK